MKRFLMWAGAKIRWFFWSWRFPAFVLAIALLVVLFYGEEDWRGAHRWAATKEKWEAKGETFDLAKFVPPSIPDDQNLGALPLFKLEHDSESDGLLEPLALRKAIRRDMPGYNRLSTGSAKPDGSPDLAKMRKDIAQNYAVIFPGAKPPADPLEQFDALYPFLKDFLAAAAVRPACRLPGDYTTVPPAARSLGLVVEGIGLSRVLMYQATLAVDEHRPDLALADIEANYAVLAGVKRDPTLVAGLVAIGMVAIIQPAIADGLARHAWSDAQLEEIERTYESANFLADRQYAMRGEAAYEIGNIETSKRVDANTRHLFRQVWNEDVPISIRLVSLWPRGWWDDNKSQTADFALGDLATVDPKARRAFPVIDREMREQNERAAARWDANAPWNYLFTVTSGAVSNQTTTFACAQVRIDETRIACALERYRLAHGTFPGSLEALTPAFIDGVPQDVMSGQPYRYRLQPDGAYLLYSIGWPQRDEGGKIAYDNDQPPRQDFKRGNWPWTMPK